LLRLSSGARWNQRLDDWRMLVQLAPAGGFAATIGDGTIVKTAIGIDYGSFGWIAMMLVDPAWLGRGLGARLLEAAMGAVPEEIAIAGYSSEYTMRSHAIGVQPLRACAVAPR
jgi:GNAT superfamily N-acetyltransferase